MKSNYKKIGDYIELVDERNKDLSINLLLGLSISKEFIPSVANIVGADMASYKIIRKGQFACSIMQVRRDKKMPVALLEDYEEAIISQAYPVFKIKDETKLLPEYLMMWFTRSEFDRHACFLAVGGVRGSLEWEDFLEINLPVPSIEKQQAIVKEYNTVVNRIKLNENLNQKLEVTAQTLYRHWFVENGDSIESVELRHFVEFNPKHSISKGEEVSYVEMADVQESSMSLKNIVMREYTSGTKFKNYDTLLARITPCLENGKTAFVTELEKGEVAYGSTEFIVMRARKNVSPYWVYCLARDENFRSHAISSMIGSSGRQRVHSDYLEEYNFPEFETNTMNKFESSVQPYFEEINFRSKENRYLILLKNLILAKMTKLQIEENKFSIS